jgi:hypothetical protein
MIDVIKTIFEEDYYSVKKETFEIEGSSVDQLTVDLNFDDFPELPTLKIYLMFLKDLEKELNGVSVLQYYLPFTVGDQNTEVLQNKIITINKRLFLGHLGLNEQNVYLKYCQTIHNTDQDTLRVLILNTLSAIKFQFTSNISEF